MATADIVAMDTQPQNMYQKYVKPRLQSDPEFRAKYIKHYTEVYIRKYKTDEDFHKAVNERAKNFMRKKYQTDPEFREEQKERCRQYRLKQKALKSASQQ